MARLLPRAVYSLPSLLVLLTDVPCPLVTNSPLGPVVLLTAALLLDSGGEKLPVAGDGRIKLSWRVVSVECIGEVIVQVKASEGASKLWGRGYVFTHWRTVEASVRLTLASVKWRPLFCGHWFHAILGNNNGSSAL